MKSEGWKTNAEEPPTIFKTKNDKTNLNLFYMLSQVAHCTTTKNIFIQIALTANMDQEDAQVGVIQIGFMTLAQCLRDLMKIVEHVMQRRHFARRHARHMSVHSTHIQQMNGATFGKAKHAMV